MNPFDKLGAELIKLGGWVKHNFFKKSDYITTSRGAVDAGLPVLTNASGVLDSTLTGGGGGGANVAYTNAVNAFTRQNSYQLSASDFTLGSEMLTNGSFDSGLTGWTDDGSGWSVVGGSLVHATGGADGYLTQVVAIDSPSVDLIQFTISGATAGYVEVYTDSYEVDAISANGQASGTLSNIGYWNAGATATITVYCTNDFDGRIEIVSAKKVTSGFPALTVFKDLGGTTVSEVRINANHGIFWGIDAGKYALGKNIGWGDYSLSAITTETGNVAYGHGSGQGATCNGGLFYGDGSGASETVDKQLHIGNNGDIISGTMDGGNVATQTLTLHAQQTDFAGVITVNGSDTWDLGGYNAVAPAATGYVEVIIGGVTYKLLAST